MLSHICVGSHKYSSFLPLSLDMLVVLLLIVSLCQPRVRLVTCPSGTPPLTPVSWMDLCTEGGLQRVFGWKWWHPSLFCGVSAAICLRISPRTAMLLLLLCVFRALFVFIIECTCVFLKIQEKVVHKDRTPQVIQAVLPKRGQWIQEVCLLRKVIKDQPPAHLDGCYPSYFQLTFCSPFMSAFLPNCLSDRWD